MNSYCADIRRAKREDYLANISLIIFYSIVTCRIKLYVSKHFVSMKKYLLFYVCTQSFVIAFPPLSHRPQGQRGKNVHFLKRQNRFFLIRADLLNVATGPSADEKERWTIVDRQNYHSIILFLQDFYNLFICKMVTMAYG